MNAQQRTFTFASSKGGVGKSTLCIMLAGAYAKRGLSVHVLDLDENATVARWFGQHNVALPGLKVSAVTPDQFSDRLREVREGGADLIFIDVAGVYEKTLLQAMARSSLVIIPAQPSEPDLHEATKVVRDLQDLNESFGGSVPYRLLVNLCEPLAPLYQRHALAEIERLGLSRFETLVHKRAPYRETFLNGVPPHFDTDERDSVLKAVAEIDAVIDEVEALSQQKPQRRKAA